MNRLLLIWFLFIASGTAWIPAYEGDTGGEQVVVVPIYALVAGVTAIGVRARTGSARDALLSAVPVLGLLGAAALAGHLRNDERAEFRGEPIYLYFGIALWVSWAALVITTALAERTKWSGLAGVGVGAFVAAMGWILFTARID